MERYGISDLLHIMELLRSPEGCPWDKAQTHQSVRKNMLEEAYEVAEAIDQQDSAHLKEELGDVLLQVVFHAQMSKEAGEFTFDDVVDGVCQKLVFRHPHVFGTVDAQDADRALETWEAQKRTEKGQQTAADTLDAVARSLPSLTRAEKIQRKAEKAGFDWDCIGPVLDKIDEEAGELRRAVEEHSNMEEELGDLLFVTAKAGRFLGLDSELALHAACEKFIRRFRRVEELAGGKLDELDVPALESLWRQVKQEESPSSNA
jgi:tetrapyrrole methylase family protein/MazG family protein